MPIPKNNTAMARAGVAAAAVMLGVIGLTGWRGDADPNMGIAPSYATPMSQDKLIGHVLDRLAFGPRPGMIDQVRQVGLQEWIDAQLHPDTINDSAVDAKLAAFSELAKPPEDLMLAYQGDSSKIIKERLKSQELVRKPDGTLGTGPTAPNATQAQMANMTPREMEILNTVEQSGFKINDSVEAVGELMDAKICRAVESNKQLQEVLVDFWSNHFNLDVKKGPVRVLRVVDDRDVIRPHVFGKFRDLLGASAKSPAMLFYLDNALSSREYMAGPRGGRRIFATANAGQPGLAVAATVPAQQGAKKGGINENYAREIMELHTLGVDGGYTQKDVTEVARCLTGWSIDRKTGTFIFRPFMHDNGAKTVLGHYIAPGGGQSDGETVLDILASHPSTAHFISYEMCQRFIADNPPATAVDRAARVFLQTGGDLREVTRSIVTSPEFLSAAAYRSKIKSPFEFAISSVRAMGGSIEPPDPAAQFDRVRLVSDGAVALTGKGGKIRGPKGRYYRASLAGEIAAMGQPLFSYQAPTGWSEDSSKWVSTGALVARLNFALALTGHQVAEVTIDPVQMLNGVAADDHDAVLQKLVDGIDDGDINPATRATLLKEMPEDTPANPAKMTALMLGSPEFQRR